MNFKPNFALLLALAVLATQPCFAQLRSVVETEAPPRNRLARLSEDGASNSGRSKFDHIAMNQPSDAPSVLLSPDYRPDSEALQSEEAQRQPEEPVRIRVKGPTELMRGRVCPFVATIENPTSRMIRDLQISLSPDSRFAPVANSQSTLFLDQLAPKFRAQFEFILSTQKTGVADLEFVTTGRFDIAHATNGTTQNETSAISVSNFHRVEVVSPPVEAEFSGPSLLHIGTEAEYAVKIINTSDRPVHNVKVALQFPAGLEVTILDRVSDPIPKQRLIIWHVPFINNDHHEVIRYKAQAIGKGQQVSHIDVVMGEQPQGMASLTTEVVGNSNRAIKSDASR